MPNRRITLLALTAALVLGPTHAQTQTQTPQTQTAPQYTVVDPKFDALPGAQVLHGSRNGYGYRIEVPANWNGEVVMYAHGYRGTGLNLTVSDVPLRKHLIEKGFAWAASSYSANGWAVREGSDETRDLLVFFGEKFAQPKRAYLYGTSMGGNVVTDSLEAYPNVYAGALAECGVMTGTELFDYFLSYSLVGEMLTGQRLVPNTLDDAEFVQNVYLPSIKPKLGEPGAYTFRGRQFDSIIKNLSGGERPFRIEGLKVPYGQLPSFYSVLFGFGRAGGVVNHNQGRNVLTNADTRYQIDQGLGATSEAINKRVRRISADPAVRNLAAPAPYGIPSGNINVPVMSIHTTGDAFVPIFLQASYRKLVNAAGKGDLLVQRAIRRPAHCQFTETERAEAFDDLVKWVRAGAKPKGEDMLGSLSDVGREWTKPLLPNDPGNR